MESYLVRRCHQTKRGTPKLITAMHINAASFEALYKQVLPEILGNLADHEVLEVSVEKNLIFRFNKGSGETLVKPEAYGAGHYLN